MLSRFTDCGSILVCGCAALAACAARGVPPGDAGVVTRDYIVEHRAALEHEIQLGSGDHLYELSRLADCRNLPELNRALHRRHAEIFPVPPPSNEQVAEHLVLMLRQDRALVCRDLETDRQRPFAAGTRHVESPERR
ncbi:MAG: hypothetical protein RL033_6607 [Pseudomonadota bacterium]|jgi:hypothetical protein